MVKYATYIRLMLVIAVMLMPTSSFDEDVGIEEDGFATCILTS